MLIHMKLLDIYSGGCPEILRAFSISIKFIAL
jgi:hypothetical protein